MPRILSYINTLSIWRLTYIQLETNTQQRSYPKQVLNVEISLLNELEDSTVSTLETHPPPQTLKIVVHTSLCPTLIPFLFTSMPAPLPLLLIYIARTYTSLNWSLSRSYNTTSLHHCSNYMLESVLNLHQFVASAPSSLESTTHQDLSHSLESLQIFASSLLWKALHLCITFAYLRTVTFHSSCFLIYKHINFPLIVINLQKSS